MDEDTAAKAICIDLYGACKCVLADRDACDAMVGLVEMGETAETEMTKIHENSMEPKE